MKKAIFGSVLALMAGGAVAQIEQQSRTTSNTNSRSTSNSQSFSKSKSIGAIFFPLFARGNPFSDARPEVVRFYNECAQIFNGEPYAYGINPAFFKKIMESKKAVTSLDEYDVTIPVRMQDPTDSINYQYERIGRATHHGSIMQCGAVYRGIIELALQKIAKNNKGQYIRPNSSAIDQAIAYALDHVDEPPYNREYFEYKEKVNPICQVPTYTAITKGNRDFVTCGPYEYHPNPIKWVKNGVTVLSEDTLNGEKIVFTEGRTSEATKGQSTTGERTKRANVAN